MPAPGAAVPHTATDPSRHRRREDWDAGEMGCGDLVLAVRLRMDRLGARATLKLVARDPGAKEDLPAWCRLTGHKLLAHSHPVYWIQRKE